MSGEKNTASRADLSSDADPDDDRRSLSARWLITASLTTLSASQIGSQESDYCDQTFERDEAGCPVLYGTTLAGALRSCLSDRLAGYRAPQEATEAGLVFGTPDGVDTHESQVIVFDSRADSPADTALRDGVRIDPSTGLAADHYKYDRELALPGVVFPLRFDLLVSAEAKEQALLEALLLALEDLAGPREEAAVSIGARRTRGLGLCHVGCFRAERFDLTTLEGWLAYADAGYDAAALEYLPQARECADPHEAVQAAWPDILRRPRTDRRKQLLLDFTLTLDSTLLIRSPGAGPNAPDSVHLTEAGRDLLSGTGLIGAVRRQVRRVLNSIPLSEQDRVDFLEDLFGPEPNSANAPAASRVRLVGEPELLGARRYRQTRTAIDRISAATVEAALFEEEPCVGGWLRFRINVRQPLWSNTDCDAPLLLLAGRDLLEHLLALGGEESIGRGLVSGTVTATLEGPDQLEQVFIMTSQQGVAEADIERFEALLLPLRKHLNEDVTEEDVTEEDMDTAPLERIA